MLRVEYDSLPICLINVRMFPQCRPKFQIYYTQSVVNLINVLQTYTMDCAMSS